MLYFYIKIKPKNNELKEQNIIQKFINDLNINDLNIKINHVNNYIYVLYTTKKLDDKFNNNKNHLLNELTNNLKINILENIQTDLYTCFNLSHFKNEQKIYINKDIIDILKSTKNYQNYNSITEYIEKILNNYINLL